MGKVEHEHIFLFLHVFISLKPVSAALDKTVITTGRKPAWEKGGVRGREGGRALGDARWDVVIIQMKLPLGPSPHCTRQVVQP